jgi:hypothetical protein
MKGVAFEVENCKEMMFSANQLVSPIPTPKLDSAVMK